MHMVLDSHHCVNCVHMETRQPDNNPKHHTSDYELDQQPFTTQTGPIVDLKMRGTTAARNPGGIHDETMF